MSSKQLEIGDRAPDFKALTDSGESIKLSDYRGKKIVLYFYARTVARETRSLAVIASREDHFAEVFATGGALIGIVLARTVWPPLDAIAALWVAAVILLRKRNGVQIVMEI